MCQTVILNADLVCMVALLNWSQVSADEINGRELYLRINFRLGRVNRIQYPGLCRVLNNTLAQDVVYFTVAEHEKH